MQRERGGRSNPRRAAVGSSIVGAGVLALVPLGGCSMERTYEGHTRDQVWSAMVDAAKSPRYRDWIVMDNSVWCDEPDARIEILRELKRDVVLPGQKPYREEMEWRLKAVLAPEYPPQVKFSTQDLCVPAHFWLQADHFFDEVQSRLATTQPMPPAPITVPLDQETLLPPASITESPDRRDDIVDSVPGVAPGTQPAPPQPEPAPAPPRSSGKSEPIDIP
ncbi:MAG: hypothetical protein FJ253_02135 [Phycisphaerae bacterium]|nr:hypothetical protein [Phycisphaerae bacterium]